MCEVAGGQYLAAVARVNMSGAAVAGAAATAAESNQAARTSRIAAVAADRLCHDPMPEVARRVDDAVVIGDRRSAIAADASVTGRADDPVAVAAGSGRAAEALRKDADRARAAR